MRTIGNTPVDGEVRAVASGTLPSGQPVIVNSDGTVSVASESSVSQSVTAPTQFSNTQNLYYASAYDTNAQKIVIAWRGLSTYGWAVVGTISGTSISFGTEVAFHSAATNYISATYDENEQKIVIAYSDDRGRAVVGTVSGTSISFGTEASFNPNVNTGFISATYDANAQKVVIAHKGSSTSSTRGAATVGTVSGTSITFGTPVVFEVGTTQEVSCVYDATAQKVVIAFSDVSDTLRGKAIVGTVSGTSISFGSVALFNSGATSQIKIAYDANAQKVVIVYRDAGNSNYGTAIVGTVSGTGISFGTEVTFVSAHAYRISITYDSFAQKVVIAFADVANSQRPTAVAGTVSGTSISFGSPVVLETDPMVNDTASVYDSASKKVVIVYGDNPNNTGEAVLFTNAATSTNLTAENYIGIADGVVKTFSQSEALGTESTFEADDVYGSASGYHVAEKKTLLMFRDQNDSGKIKARLVTTTGTTLSYGSVVELTGQVGYPKSIVYDSANEKLVVTFRGNTNYAYAVVATISGSSLTFGTPVVFNSATSSVCPGVYDSTSGKIVVTYALSGVSYLKVATVSGTSISFGSATSLGSGSGMYYGTLAYDPVNNKTIFAQMNDITYDGVAYVATVSGTSISVGSPTTFNANLAKIYGAFYDAPSGKIGVIVQTGGGPGEGYVGTVSGTSISFGSGVQFQSSISQGTTGYDSRVNKFTVACRSINSPYPGLLRIGTISGNTFSFASPVTFNSGETALDNHGVGFDSDQGTSIISFMDGGDGDVGKAIGFQAAGSYEVSSSVADGDSAVINSTCTVDSNQSGLTAGQQYFVQTDGTLGLTAADPSVFAGTAVSATKLIVKG